MFLSTAELQDLTGYVQPAAQRRWLAENGYRFDVRSDGRPSVLADQVRARQNGQVSQRKPGPDFSWMTEAQ